MYPVGVLFFILGLVVGSFLNVLIYRLPKNQSILGRSYCDRCKKTLPWFDLIPLLSFVFLSGRCRFCKKKIDWQIPTVELLSALSFVFIFLKFPLVTSLSLWFYLFFTSSLIAIFFIDLENGIIPDKITFPLFAVSVFYILPDFNFVNHLFSFIFTFLFFFLIFFVTQGRGIGFGDVKLASILGLVFGFPQIIVLLYLAFLTGGLISLILILWEKKHFRKDTISFGPFLVFGTMLTIFWGNQLVLLSSNFW